MIKIQPRTTPLYDHAAHSLDDLPEEVVHSVLSYLEPRTLRKMAATSRRYHKLTSDTFLPLRRRQLWHRFRHGTTGGATTPPALHARLTHELALLCGEKSVRQVCGDLVEMCEYAAIEANMNAFERLSAVLLETMPASLRAILSTDNAGLVEFTLNDVRRELNWPNTPADVFDKSAEPLSSYLETSLVAVLRALYPASVLPADAHARVQAMRNAPRLRASLVHVHHAILHVRDNIVEIGGAMHRGEYVKSAREETLEPEHRHRVVRLFKADVRTLCPDLWIDFLAEIGAPPETENLLAHAVAIRAAASMAPAEVDATEAYAQHPDTMAYNQTKWVINGRLQDGDLAILLALHIQRTYVLSGDAYARIEMLQHLERCNGHYTSPLTPELLTPPDIASIAVTAQRLSQLSAALPASLAAATNVLNTVNPPAFDTVLSLWLTRAPMFEGLRTGGVWEIHDKRIDTSTLAIYRCLQAPIEHVLAQMDPADLVFDPSYDSSSDDE